ncbi:MAG: homoserine dehydrogenase [Planctomycetota bacterium]|jgi:homoserine dehydrogenase
MDPYRLGLLGHGTVGRGVVDLLHRTSEECGRRTGRHLEVTAIAVGDPTRPRALPEGCAARITGDPLEICRDPAIDLVVELVGGIDAPREWIRAALEAGKDVVTANKAVLATHGEELFELARDHDCRLLFEASVAAAIPVIQVLQHGLPAGPVDRLLGILNGTSNRILGRLEGGMPFAEALAEAQRDGFAEADPTLDLSGWDAGHKLALLTRLVLGTSVPLDTLKVEGIERIEPIDLAFGARHHWCLKSIAELRRRPEGISLRVAPTWIADNSELAAVHDEYNAVLLEAETFGTLVLQGKGAGGLPTAGSVVADILRAARGEGRTPATPRQELRILEPGSSPSRHYVRFRAKDRPGVLARIAGALAEEGVSIASVEQPEPIDPSAVPVHLITHPVATTVLDAALSRLGPNGILSEDPLRIRIDALPSPLPSTRVDEGPGATKGATPCPA